MNGQPTASQKRFHQWCRDNGCRICGDENPAIHHIKGSKMKLKGCVKPGEWFILPLCHHHHQSEYGIHANKKQFAETYGTQKWMWSRIVTLYKHEFGEKPMTEEEYLIILERA